jgi:hypothetical protein
MLFFPKRIGRSSYFIRHCAIALLVWGIAGSGILQESEVTGWIFLLLSLIYWLLWVVLPRVRDLSMSTFWLILAFVPVVDAIFGLILLFRPSAIAWPRSIDTAECHGPEENRRLEAGMECDEKERPATEGCDTEARERLKPRHQQKEELERPKNEPQPPPSGAAATSPGKRKLGPVAGIMTMLAVVIGLAVFAAIYLGSPQTSPKPTTSTEAAVQPPGNLPVPVAVLTPSPAIIATPSNPTLIPAAIPRVGSNARFVPVRISGVKSGDVVWWTKQHRVNPALTNTDDFELYGKVLDVVDYYTPPQVMIFHPDTTVKGVTFEDFFNSGEYFLKVEK